MCVCVYVLMLICFSNWDVVEAKYFRLVFLSKCTWNRCLFWIWTFNWKAACANEMNSHHALRNICHTWTCVYSINYFHQYMTLVCNKIATKTNQNSKRAKARERASKRESEKKIFTYDVISQLYTKYKIPNVFVHVHFRVVTHTRAHTHIHTLHMLARPRTYKYT